MNTGTRNIEFKAYKITFKAGAEHHYFVDGFLEKEIKAEMLVHGRSLENIKSIISFPIKLDRMADANEFLDQIRPDMW